MAAASLLPLLMLLGRVVNAEGWGEETAEGWREGVVCDTQCTAPCTPQVGGQTQCSQLGLFFRVATRTIISIFLPFFWSLLDAKF